jgi:hypothetical protein
MMATRRSMIDDVEVEEEVYACPIATRDLAANLKARNFAFEHYGYGPANPNDTKNNRGFWLKKATMLNTSVMEAMGMRCGNCSAFIQTSQMLECIKAGIEAKDPRQEAGYDEDVIESAGLGYCELLHFKCADTRTCDAWLVGGPITDKKEEENGDD